MHSELVYLFPDWKRGDWILQDDGEGVFIKQWNRPEPQPTAEKLLEASAPATKQAAINANTDAIQAALDRGAQGYGYDNIVSACSYAAQPEGSPFQSEGAAFLAWRSAVWTHAYSVLAEVDAGTRLMPTPEESVSMMPSLVLP